MRSTPVSGEPPPWPSVASSPISALTCQVLCVTHLPQVAAHAEDHFVIERDGPRASVRKVDGEDRLTELSRMLAGLPESDHGREAAAELLEGARTR